MSHHDLGDEMQARSPASSSGTGRFRRAGPACPTCENWPTPRGALGRTHHATHGKHVDKDHKSAHAAYHHAARARKTAKKPPRATPELAYAKAKELGWIRFFRGAAAAHGFLPETLMGIGYQETHLDPIYLTKGGDVHHGTAHGFGLMQVDIRYFPLWVNEGKWKDADECIRKGAEILADKREIIRSEEGKTVRLPHTKHKFVGARLDRLQLLRVSIAAYNGGEFWAYSNFSKHHNADRGTHGGHYSAQVLAYTARFKALLDADEAAAQIVGRVLGEVLDQLHFK